MAEQVDADATFEELSRRLEDGLEEADAALEALAALVKDERPSSAQAANLIAAAIRRGLGDQERLARALAKRLPSARPAVAPLLLGLLALLKDAAARARLEEVWRSDGRDLLDPIVCDRALTAVSWLRSEELLQAVKRLTSRLEDGRLAWSAVVTLKILREFIKEQRKPSPGQRQQFEDMARRLALDAEQQARLLRPFGVSAFAELRSSEAKDLIARLTGLVQHQAGDVVTPRQLSFIRRLIKQLGLGVEALGIIAEEAGKKDIVELTKTEASEVIEWLLAKAGEGQGERTS